MENNNFLEFRDTDGDYIKINISDDDTIWVTLCENYTRNEFYINVAQTKELYKFFSNRNHGE